MPFGQFDDVLYTTTPEEAQFVLTAQLATHENSVAWNQPAPYMRADMTNRLATVTQAIALILAQRPLTGAT